jgi:hypothetical protein
MPSEKEAQNQPMAEARRLGCTDCAMSTTKEYMNSG